MTENKQAIQKSDNTKCRNEWTAFLQEVKSAGFKEAYHKTFDGSTINQTVERYKEEEYIFYHEAGYVLYAESIFGGTSYASINQAKLYYQATQHHKYYRRKLIPCNGKLEIYHDNDVEKNFLRHLAYIPKQKTVSPVWTIKDPALLFVNYQELLELGYDHQAISRRKIDASVPELRKIINGK